VAFHEGFWLITGTAAPVVALAAVVSLADAGTVHLDAMSAAVSKVRSAPTERIVDYWKWSRSFSDSITAFVALLALIGLFNLFLQAALLTVSLVSVADGDNLVPPWLAIVAAVGGLLLLIVSSFGVYGMRRLRQNREFDLMSQEMPS
jgi:hypothetical protein